MPLFVKARGGDRGPGGPSSGARCRRLQHGPADLF